MHEDVGRRSMSDLFGMLLNVVTSSVRIMKIEGEAVCSDSVHVRMNPVVEVSRLY